VAGFDHLPPGIVPYAVGKQAAAALISISAGFFDKLVGDGRMPEPRELDGRVLWDSEEVKAAWRAIPKRGQAARRNSFDEDAAP
jgi:hypothetical protein